MNEDIQDEEPEEGEEENLSIIEKQQKVLQELLQLICFIYKI